MNDFEKYKKDIEKKYKNAIDNEINSNLNIYPNSGLSGDVIKEKLSQFNNELMEQKMRKKLLKLK